MIAVIGVYEARGLNPGRPNRATDLTDSFYDVEDNHQSYDRKGQIMSRTLQITLALLIGMALVTPAFAQGEGRRGRRGPDGPGREHWEQQHRENVEFRETLKGMEPAEAIAAIKAHRTMQHRENLLFFIEQKERRIERINANERLTDDQKAELVSFVEVMHARKVAFADRHHQAFMAMLDELAEDPELTLRKIVQALKEFHEEHKEAVREFREAQRAAWKAKLEEVIGPRPDRPAGRRNDI